MRRLSQDLPEEAIGQLAETASPRAPGLAQPPDASRFVAFCVVFVFSGFAWSHGARDDDAAVKRGEAFSGTPVGPEGGRIPNITPDAGTGIGRWSDGDLKSLFTMGMLPDADCVGSGMAEVVETTTSKLTDADRDAIIVYLYSLPPFSKRIESAK